MLRASATICSRAFFTRAVAVPVPARYKNALRKYGLSDDAIEQQWKKTLAIDDSVENAHDKKRKECENIFSIITSVAFSVLRHHRHSLTEMLDITEAFLFDEENEHLKKYVIAGAVKNRHAIPRTFFGDPDSSKSDSK